MKKHYTAKELIDSGSVFHGITFDFINKTNDIKELFLLACFFGKQIEACDLHMKTLDFKIFKRIFNNEYYKNTIRDYKFCKICMDSCLKKIKTLKEFSQKTKNQ
jgi:hypothetical protein